MMHLKQRHPHLQVVLSIGGSTASEVFPVVASSTLLRDNFARSCLGLVEASGLDGIDSEYEKNIGVMIQEAPAIVINSHAHTHMQVHN